MIRCDLGAKNKLSVPRDSRPSGRWWRPGSGCCCVSRDRRTFCASSERCIGKAIWTRAGRAVMSRDPRRQFGPDRSLNNVVTEPVLQLRELIPTTPLLIADLILCEVLQGFRTEAQARPGFTPME